MNGERRSTACMLARPAMVRKALLVGGVLSSLLYVIGIDVIAAVRYPDYHDYANQMVSELLAVGAPTRTLMVWLFIPYNALVFALAVGVWASAGETQAVRFTAVALLGYGAVSTAGLLLFPMDLRGTAESQRDTLHIINTIVMSIFIVAVMAFGARAHGPRFRRYSLATIATVVVCGAAAGVLARPMPGPTPWLGLAERVNIYATMLWLAVLAVSLLRAQGRASTRQMASTASGSRRVLDAVSRGVVVLTGIASRRRVRPVGDESRPARHGGLGSGAILVRNDRWASTSLHRMAAASFVARMLAPSQGSAQALQSFEDLPLRVNRDDELQVEDQSGAAVTGRLTHLTRDAIAIQTATGETRLARDEVRTVAVRSHPLGKGALIAAAAFAVLGGVVNCSRNGGGRCALVGVFAAPIGAGVGLVAGALTSRMGTVYRAPEHGALVPSSGGATGAEASLLEDLALRVNLDDRLQVEDASGTRTTGRLTRLTVDAITLQTAGGERHVTRETLRQVALRRRPLRIAVLIGAGAGVVAGVVAGCAGPDREECADAPIMAGALGAGLGLAAGALIHTSTIVYPDSERRTSVAPAIARDAFGVLVSRRW